MPQTHTFSPYTYHIPVELYIQVYNARFPTHRLFPYILDSEILDCQFHPESGDWKLRRKVVLDVDAPGWFKTITGIHTAVFVEDSEFTRSKRTLRVVTINESLSNKATLEDVSIYEPHPENDQWCLFSQSGTCTLHVIAFGFHSKIENYFIGLYANRYDEARKLDLLMIETVQKQLASGEALFDIRNVYEIFKNCTTAEKETQNSQEEKKTNDTELTTNGNKYENEEKVRQLQNDGPRIDAKEEASEL